MQFDLFIVSCGEHGVGHGLTGPRLYILNTIEIDNEIIQDVPTSLNTKIAEHWEFLSQIQGTLWHSGIPL